MTELSLTSVEFQIRSTPVKIRNVKKYVWMRNFYLLSVTESRNENSHVLCWGSFQVLDFQHNLDNIFVPLNVSNPQLLHAVTKICIFTLNPDDLYNILNEDVCLWLEWTVSETMQ